MGFEFATGDRPFPHFHHPMPLYPHNSNHAASAPADHTLAPIAEAPVSASIGEEHNPNHPFSPPHFSPHAVLAPAEYISPWAHELHEAFMVQERGGFLLSWNSITGDDLPGAFLVSAPSVLPRPVSARTEPLDTFPPYSPTLQELSRVGRPVEPAHASSPPLERHGGNFPPYPHENHPGAAAHALRPAVAGLRSNMHLPLEHSDGSLGALSLPWPATMNDGTPQAVYNSALGSPMHARPADFITTPAPGPAAFVTLLSSNPAAPSHMHFFESTMPQAATPAADQRAANDPQAMGVTPDSDGLVELLGAIDRGTFMGE